jgi:hypothetical protein
MIGGWLITNANLGCINTRFYMKKRAQAILVPEFNGLRWYNQKNWENDKRIRFCLQFYR